MEIKEQSGLRAVLKDISIPPMYVVQQNFPQDGIPDVSACLREKLDWEELRSRIRPGMRVVLTAGSRQIAHMPEIFQELARFLKGQGAKPYIIPTMGSHGGATAEGQRNILESYGITEEFCECPIFSSMETVEVGKMPDGDPVRMDRFAFESDAVVVDVLSFPLWMSVKSAVFLTEDLSLLTVTPVRRMRLSEWGELSPIPLSAAPMSPDWSK